MKARFMLPAIAALALLAAAPASAQSLARGGYDPQGGGGAGPYVLGCRAFQNFNQKQRCSDIVMSRQNGNGRFAVPILGELFQ
jgi:hypothetical protein